MLDEIIKLQIIKNEKIKNVKLYLYEIDSDNMEFVKIQLHYDDEVFEFSAENYFNALIKLRTRLEKNDMKILCKGAQKNVYPSRMTLEMGTGRKAYQLMMNKKAKMDDLVDIFDPSTYEKYGSILEQEEFYNSWLNSFRG